MKPRCTHLPRILPPVLPNRPPKPRWHARVRRSPTSSGTAICTAAGSRSLRQRHRRSRLPTLPPQVRTTPRGNLPPDKPIRPIQFLVPLLRRLPPVSLLLAPCRLRTPLCRMPVKTAFQVHPATHRLPYLLLPLLSPDNRPSPMLPALRARETIFLSRLSAIRQRAKPVSLTLRRLRRETKELLRLPQVKRVSPANPWLIRPVVRNSLLFRESPRPRKADSRERLRGRTEHRQRMRMGKLRHPAV